jgi:hypothetical protein
MASVAFVTTEHNEASRSPAKLPHYLVLSSQSFGSESEVALNGFACGALLIAALPTIRRKDSLDDVTSSSTRRLYSDT